MKNLKETAFDLYRIDHDYIRFLREREPNVTDPDFTDIYCGPVYCKETERGLVEYYVPLDINALTSATGIFETFKNGILADFFDFKKMIPCSPKCIMSADLTKLRGIPVFCQENQKLMKDCAEFVMSGKLCSNLNE